MSGDVSRVFISGTKPTAMTANPALGLAYSANFGTHSVSVISS